MDSYHIEVKVGVCVGVATHNSKGNMKMKKRYAKTYLV